MCPHAAFLLPKYDGGKVTQVTIGVRLRSAIGWNSFWQSVLGLNKYGNLFLAEKGYSAAACARLIFRKFLAHPEQTHLLLLDDDAVVAPETITRLLSRNLPVVGGLTWTGGLPTMPTLYRGFESAIDAKTPSWKVRYEEVANWLARPEVQKEVLDHQHDSGLVLDYNPTDALSRADGIGFHCVLIRRDVLETIGEPFLEPNDVGTREDFDFSERAIRAGFDLFVDKTVFVGHTIPHSIRPLDFYVYMRVQAENAQDAAKLQEGQGK